MKLRYIGPKPIRTVEFPIPVLSRNAVEGTVTFTRNEVSDCRDEWAVPLLEMCGEYFQRVDAPAAPAKEEKSNSKPKERITV